MTVPECETVDEMIRRRRGDPNTALLFEDEHWTWDEHARASATRAALARERRRPGSFHIGYLLENVPELSFWLGAGAVSGAAMVGINPTRRGAELATDVRHTDCQLVVTERKLLGLLDGLDIGVTRDRVFVVDTDEYRRVCAEHATASFPEQPVSPDAIALLVFTSGTAGAPKASVVSQRRLARYGRTLSADQELTAESVCYQAMPMFHSNALYAGWSPAVYVGATIAMRRRFSASAFVDDVRRYRATYFNYVGKPLSYILATPPRPDDRDNALVRVIGNEGTEQDIERFSARFGVPVTDNYGSTEGGVTVMRSPDQPPGALGRLPEGALVVDPESGTRRAPARFDDVGRLVNPLEAIGEIVNTGPGSFEGYYKNDEAVRVRTRNGWYWSGDLGYADADGWLWFAGRNYDWLRVDGENFAAAPVERIVCRFPGVVLGAVYAVPAVDVGDEVMVALQLEPATEFDARAFDEFLGAQADLGVKWSPRYVRIAERIPVTATTKILKRELRAERWECTDPIWWRPRRGQPFVRMTPDDVASIRQAFTADGRANQLDAY
jgi:acyl-CoA synthetase (AMP-forming)/AMP-acid ligase II